VQAHVGKRHRLARGSRRRPTVHAQTIGRAQSPAKLLPCTARHVVRNVVFPTWSKKRYISTASRGHPFRGYGCSAALSRISRAGPSSCNPKKAVPSAFSWMGSRGPSRAGPRPSVLP
jgi:hypothetical protein